MQLLRFSSGDELVDASGSPKNVGFLLVSAKKSPKLSEQLANAI